MLDVEQNDVHHMSARPFANFGHSSASHCAAAQEHRQIHQFRSTGCYALSLLIQKMYVEKGLKKILRTQ